jgi:hypothetical protein
MDLMQNTSLDLDLVYNAFLDQMHNTFLDLYLVHNIFKDVNSNMVHNIILDLVGTRKHQRTRIGRF